MSYVIERFFEIAVKGYEADEQSALGEAARKKLATAQRTSRAKL